MKILIRHNRHGFGDAAQFTIVLKHLRHYHPDWEIEVEVGDKQQEFPAGLCDKVWTRSCPSNEKKYDRTFSLDWSDPNRSCRNAPSTKVTRCLQEVFGLEPLESLYYYQLGPDPASEKAADSYLQNIPRGKGPVVIHYTGLSGGSSKNLEHADVKCLCDYIIQVGYTPIILDYERRSPIPDQRTVFSPETNCLRGLIARAALFIGIDSGPLHVAAATTTPSIGVWKKHHPVNFFDLSSNVTHLLPRDARKYIKGVDREIGQRYFEKNYKFSYYDDMLLRLLHEVSDKLKTPFHVPSRLPQLTSRSFGESYYLEHRDIGIDYAIYGDWQKQYCRWLSDCLVWNGKNVLDVGCACGAFVRGFKDNGVAAVGCDINEHCIKMGRAKWRDLSLVICDAANLHAFDDNQFNGIHLMQTLGAIKPALVPFVAAELGRVSKMGSLLFSVHDTEDRVRKAGGSCDPLRLCVRPRDWWSRVFRMAGWEEKTAEYDGLMRASSSSFLHKYDWDWFVFKKVSDFPAT